jgi:arylsulfatase A-like enzyme
MSKLLAHAAACSLIATALFFACSGKGAHSAENPPSAPTLPPTRSASELTLPSLDESGPSLNLLTASTLLHLYGQGLVIPFVGEGFRKYSQEYTNPWRGTIKLDERVGRALGSTAATLHFPWNADTGEASILLRMHGGSAGKRLSLRLNGKPIKNANLESGWQQLVLPVPARTLTGGENTLALATGKKGALFHSIEIVAGKSSETQEPTWPAASPFAKVKIAGQERDCLTGFSRMIMPVEIPQDGWLVFASAAPAGAARFQVTVTAEDQPAKILLDEKQEPGSTRERRLALAEFSGKLVALELSIRDGRAADAAWVAPRILLPKAAGHPRPQPARNLVMLVADALRADKLPMYADSRVHTPNIAKAVQATGVTFTSTQAASPSSPPSHASIQSGCMPRVNGILGDKSKVNPGTPMVSAILAKAGIATNFVGDASFAMRRLQPVSTWNEFHMPNAEGKGGDCSAVVKQILAFADKQAGKRFFVSAVAFEAHTPYIYHQGTTEHYYDGPMDPAIGTHPDGTTLTAIVGGRLKMTPARWGQIKGLYDGEVEHLDECFGTLTEGLKSRGLDGNTDIVLLADHGEGFLEHGSMGHAYGNYAELTNVPLVFFLPGLGNGQKIPTVVSHTDVVPTIMDVLGVEPDTRIQGESLLPMILRQGPWIPRVMPSEYGRSYSLRARSLHYVVDYGGNESLYDTAADPLEKTEINAKRPLALRYFRDLAGIYLAHRAHWHEASWGTLNNHRAGFAR